MQGVLAIASPAATLKTMDHWQNWRRWAGIELNDQQCKKLDQYLDLLLSANQSMNLTRINDLESARTGHVGDALTVCKWIRPADLHLADLGSGGGIPGIPLAIVYPDKQMKLIEATGKKARFLSEAAQAIGLTKVQVVNLRGEQFVDGRGKFDVVLARAVAQIDELAAWAWPLLKKGGRLLALKGPKAQAELEEGKKVLTRLKARLVGNHPAGLDGHDHWIVELSK
jgi:16S rRNA (guanine527-N7)-methyltransferase